MASGQKNIFPGKGWYICGFQRIRADLVTLRLIIIDFRAKCCDFFFQSNFKGLGQILGFNLWALGKQQVCFAKLLRAYHKQSFLKKSLLRGLLGNHVTTGHI